MSIRIKLFFRNYRLIYVALLICLFCGSSSAMEIVGEWGTGCYQGIARFGNLIACAAAGSGVDIFFSQGSTKPVLLSKIDTPGFAQDVFISGDFLYVADSSALEIIDISDSFTPIWLGHFKSTAYKIQIIENKAYIAAGSGGFEIVDVSDPEAPFLLGKCSTPGMALDVQVIGDLAYVANESKGLQIIDVNDPYHPEILTSYEIAGHKLTRLSISDKVVSLLTNSGKIYLVNIADPAAPRPLSEITSTVLHSSAVKIIGNRLYCGDGVILCAFDISNPSNPQKLSEINLATSNISGSILDIAVQDNLVGVAFDSGGLVNLDFSYPQTPQAIGRYNHSGTAYDVQVVGNLAYLADGYSLQIIDISKPSAPKRLSYFFSIGVKTVQVRGDFAYIGVGRFFEILDVSDPDQILGLGLCQTEGFVEDISLEGDYAYIANNRGGIQVVDISNPQHPALLAVAGKDSGNRRVLGITTNENYIFAADENFGLEIFQSKIEINQEEGGIKTVTLTPVGSLSTPGFVNKIKVEDSNAYITDGYQGLQIISVNRPGRPRLIGNFPITEIKYTVNNNYAIDVEVVGERAYMLKGCNYEGALQIVDISDPVAPVLLDEQATGSDPQAVQVAGGKAFIADGKSGRLLIIDLEEKIHDDNLYFPHVSCSDDWQTEIGLINLAPIDASGELKAYDDAGQAISGLIGVYLRPGQRMEVIPGSATTFSGNYDRIAYMVLENCISGVVGYTKFYQASQNIKAALPALRVADRSSQMVNLATDNLFVSHIASNQEWWTGVALLNTTQETKNLSITFSDNRQKMISLLPGQHQSFSIRGLFGEPQNNINSAIISGTTGIIGFELFGSQKNSQLGGISLTSSLRNRLCYPHIASEDGWWTGFAVYEPSGAGSSLTLTAYRSDGAPIKPAVKVDLALGQKKFAFNDQTAKLLPSGSAWLEIAAQKDITGFELFGSGNGSQLAGYNVTGIESRHAAFPKINPQGGWAGIAIINPYDQDATINFSARNDQGTLIAAVKKLPVPARSKIIGSPEKILGCNDLQAATYISYRSSCPLIGFQINSQGRLLDALPALSN